MGVRRTLVVAAAAVVGFLLPGVPPAAADDPPPVLNVTQVQQLSVSQPATVDATPAGPAVSGGRGWVFNVHNSGFVPAATPTIRVDSGYAAAHFTRSGPSGSVPIGSFPAVATQPSLAPQADMSLSLGSDLGVSFFPGFDSARTAVPAAVPPGGGQQTVAITLTNRDVATTTLIAYLFSSVAGESVVSTTPPANLDEGESILNPPIPALAAWVLVGVRPNKAYTFSAVVQVPNPGAVALAHKDRVEVFAQALAPVPCVPDCGPRAGIGLAEVPLDGPTPFAGQAAYSVDEPGFTWQPTQGTVRVVRYAPQAATINPNAIAVEAPQQLLDLPASDDAGPAGGATVTGTKGWAVTLTNGAGPAVTPTLRIDSGHDPAGFYVEDPAGAFAPTTPVAAFPLVVTMPTVSGGQQSAPLVLRSNLPVTFAPGFTASRSPSPTTIAAGGGQQTTSVSFTATDPSATTFSGVVSGHGTSVVGFTVPANLNQGETFSRTTNAATPNAFTWSLAGARLGKAYTFTATLQVANPSGLAAPYKPQVSVTTSSNGPAPCIPSCAAASSMAVADATLDGAVPGSGRATWSVAPATVAWTAIRAVVRTVRFAGTAPSQLVDLAPTSGEAGGPVTLAATLARFGRPVGGRSVGLALGGHGCSALTGVDGRASCTVTAPAGTGTVALEATFAGTDDLLPASATLATTLGDATAPELTVPASFTADATGPSGAAVPFVVSATDLSDPAPVVDCAPASGSTFPVGTTTVSCTATDAAGHSTSGSFSVTVVLPPELTSFSPTRGTTGTVVTIVGLHLDAVTEVRFGAAAATIVSQTATRLRVSVPAGATTGPITLVRPGAPITSSQTFTVRARVDSFTPGSGAPGDEVTISGANFEGTTAVRIGGATAAFTVVDERTITATVPLAASSGPITVTTLAGTGTSADVFLVAPRITSFTPHQGVVGATVTLSGLNLAAATDVRFNGVAASFTVDGTRLVATVPAGATTGLISVTSGAGTGTNVTVFKVVPVIASSSATAGVPGDVVTLTGTSLTGATAVKFGGVVAPDVTVDSDTQLTVTVPVGARTGAITVTTPGGTASSPSPFIVPVTITGFTPAAGTVGTVVTVNGRDLDTTTGVTVGGLAAAYTVVSASRLTVVVPAGALSGAIVVTNPAGTTTSSRSFTAAPRITGFTPSEAPGGGSVTITGDNLVGATRVEVGAVRATFTVEADGSIVAVVPPTAGPGPLTVCNAGGCTTSAEDFNPIPRTTTFTAGGRVGAVVIINGTNLATTTVVTFNGVSATPTSVTDTRVRVVVPAGATTGDLVLTSAGGATTIVGTFTVT